VVREGRVLVARRSSESHLGGLWEFPGGKIEDGETPEAALERELREEMQLEAGETEPLTVYVHSYPDRTVRLHAFLVRDARGDVRTDGAREWAWVLPGDLAAHPMPGRLQHGPNGLTIQAALCYLRCE
jgi:8-oxo-dGTP diphosphatase